MTAAEVAKRLAEPLKRVAWFLGEMTRTGHAHIHALSARPAHGRYRPQSLYAGGPHPTTAAPLPPPPEPWVKPKKAAGEIIGVDADDLAWMAYWKGRWDRRQRAAKLAKLGKAA